MELKIALENALPRIGIIAVGGMGRTVAIALDDRLPASKVVADKVFPNELGIAASQIFPRRVLIDTVRVLSELAYELEEDGGISLEEDGISPSIRG